MKNTSKSFALIVIVCFSFSCIKEKPKQSKTLKFESYLDSIQTKFPNHESNTAINDELNQALEKDFKKAINNNLLSDLPLKLTEVKKCNKKYIIRLYYDLSSEYYTNFLLGRTHLEFYAITDEAVAKKLIENKLYTIECTFKEYLTYANNDKYCATVLMAPFEGFGSGVTQGELELGAIAIKLKTIKPFTPQ